MAFWNQASSDPKRAFRFKVTFGLLDDAATYLAQTAKRPTFTISDGTKVDFLDKAFHFPGKVTWEPVTIKFVDSESEGVSKASYSYLTNAGWISPGNAAFTPGNIQNNSATKTIGKGSASTQTKAITIEVLNAAGVSVDIWKLNNPFITKATFNDLSYASEEILTVEYTIRYDWADLNK
jgi:hypothetical protein